MLHGRGRRAGRGKINSASQLLDFFFNLLLFGGKILKFIEKCFISKEKKSVLVKGRADCLAVMVYYGNHVSNSNI